MTRFIVMCIIMAFAVGFVGCRSCLAPWDQCQPTFLPERGDQCMGELYRCGSNLGGSERRSDATGDCENCGGGQVEYYMENGETTTIPQDASSSFHHATPLAPFASNVSLNAYEQDFSLNADYEAY